MGLAKESKSINVNTPIPHQGGIFVKLRNLKKVFKVGSVKINGF